VAYKTCLDWMEQLHGEIVAGTREPCFILVQHPPVVTMGSRRLVQDLKVSPTQDSTPQLTGTVPYVEIDRGGSATAHEPGQLVLYPLLPLAWFGLSVKHYVHYLEQVVIDTCATFHVHAMRDPHHPGVWCGQDKIAALGVRVKDRVTKHGLAFNVTNSLDTFSWIIPCGIIDRGVTNLKRKLPASDKPDEQNLLNRAQSALVQSAQDLYSSYTGVRVQLLLKPAWIGRDPSGSNCCTSPTAEPNAQPDPITVQEEESTGFKKERTII
jgi:lipoyl(octanoyl) transferase